MLSGYLFSMYLCSGDLCSVILHYILFISLPLSIQPHFPVWLSKAYYKFPPILSLIPQIGNWLYLIVETAEDIRLHLEFSKLFHHTSLNINDNSMQYLSLIHICWKSNRIPNIASFFEVRSVSHSWSGLRPVPIHHHKTH